MSAAASTGPAFTSGDQAGYAVTGGRFGTVETWVKLPDASRFSRQLGQIGVSVQLWTSTTVLDLSATACTDATCRPGGKPKTLNYHLQFAVYHRATGKLICSTSAAGKQRCPRTPKWCGQALKPGTVAYLWLSFPIPYETVFSPACGGNDYLVSSDPAHHRPVFGQARIALEFGATPWSHALFRAPRKAIAVARFDRPPPPPYAAEIATINGSSGGIAGWWAHHQIQMTSGPPGHRSEAAPGRLWDQGYGFTVYLEP